jgi:hypothetical protein
MLGDPMGRLALSHEQESGTALTHVRFGMVIAGLLQFTLLLSAELHLPAIGLFGKQREDQSFVEKMFFSSMSLPYSVVKVH